MTSFSEYIELKKNALVTIVCGTITLICATVIFMYTRTPSYPEELTRIDTLCNKEPQKAEMELHRYISANGNMNDDDKWYCRFLSLKSNVKQSKDINYDKEAAAIIDHYETKADKHMLSQVYYYAGSAYYLLGNIPQAIEYLQKGLSITPETEETEQLRALYYYMLGGILTYQYLDDEAFEMKLKALAIHKKRKDYQRVIYDDITLAWSYKAKAKNDKALACLKEAKMLAETKNMMEKISEIYSQIADTYYELGKYEDAKEYIELALKYLDASNKSAIFNIAGKIYQASGMTERAKAFYTVLLSEGTIYSRRDAYSFLAKYYQDCGRIMEANKYCLLYGGITDTVIQTNATEFSARANAAYNYTHIEKEKDKLQVNLKYKDWIIYTSLVIFLLAVCYYISYRKKTKKRQNEMLNILKQKDSKSKEAIQRYKEELASIEEKYRAEEQKKTEYLQKYEEKAKLLEYVIQKNELLNKISVTSDAIMRDSPIHKELLLLIKEKRNISEDTIKWQELEETLFNIYPIFKGGLTKFKKMKDQAYHVCLLIKAGFNVQQIAYLTNKSIEGINSTRRRLVEVNLGRKGKPSEWDEIIREL